jgi:hypothetical protein
MEVYNRYSTRVHYDEMIDEDEWKRSWAQLEVYTYYMT